MKQKIVSYGLRESATDYTKPGVNEFKNEIRPKWLNRLCYWLYGKISRPHVMKDIQIHRVDLNEQNLMEKIREQYNYVYMYHGRQPTRLIIGQSAELNLSREILEKSHIYFYVDDWINRMSELYGMKIEIVPWMDGWVVLP